MENSTTRPPKLVVYIRVSTTKQGVKGVSMEAQEQALSHLANSPFYKDHTLVVYKEAVSAAEMKRRPEFDKALAELECGDTLAAYSLSRVSRSTRELMDLAEMLDKEGIELASITEGIDTSTAAGKMMFRMLAVISEFERDVIAERTKTALNRKKESGMVYGPVPYGYRGTKSGRLVRDPKAQEAIKLMQQARQQGRTLRAICALLKEKGYKPGRSNVWQPNTVRTILKRVEEEGRSDAA